MKHSGGIAFVFLLCWLEVVSFFFSFFFFSFFVLTVLVFVRIRPRRVVWYRRDQGHFLHSCLWGTAGMTIGG